MNRGRGGEEESESNEKYAAKEINQEREKKVEW
jgi:hypothetical protein